MTPTKPPPFLTLHWQSPWSGHACSLLAQSHGVQGSTCPTQSSSRQMRTMPHAGRKWLLKCRLRDYGAIKVTAGYGENCPANKQMSLCKTHQRQASIWRLLAPGLLSQEGRLLDSQFERLHFCCYDRYFAGRERRAADGSEAVLFFTAADLLCWAIITVHCCQS